jgi:GDSL-like Lipase/Acylhydrolase family
MPAWIAYDLSSAPEAQRHQVLVGWDAIHSPCYFEDAPTAGETRPVSYTIESNAAPGGAAPPDSGWTTLTSVTAGAYCARHHLLDLAGANWIRMNVSEGTDPSSVGFDLEVHAAPSCPSDDWLFMGDSITYMSTTYAFSDLPDLVHQEKPNYNPAVIDAAIGGTNTNTALLAIDATMKDFPGRFVVLAYGTNDHANDYHMEELVQKVIAAGKTPVVPHMPWSASASEGPAINAQIDALYMKYPTLVKGPDLWAVFLNRTDLIPATDIHPNAAGQEVLRKAWADTMAGLDE